MKRAAAIACVLALCIAGTALAAEDNWRVRIVGDDGTGMSASSPYAYGVMPDASDGVDSHDAPLGGFPGLDPAIWIGGVIPGDDGLWSTVVNSPSLPNTWDIRVGASFQETYGQIRLSWYTLGSTILPPASVGGQSLQYELTMVDNRGVAGAPANGTRWVIPIPTVHSSNVTFFQVMLPACYIGSPTTSDLIGRGYALQLTQYVVPEPSCLMALGMGALGMAGVVLRRRKSR